MINSLNRSFWARVVASTSLNVESLSAFRILVGLFLLIFNTPSFSWIADFPQAFYNPPALSLANLMNNFPDRVFFLFLDVLVLNSLICLTLGIKARVATFCFLIATLVGFNFQFSFGKIDHGTVLLFVMLGCMVFSGWGTKLALLPDKKSTFDNAAKSLSLLSIVICFGMFTAGFEKALNWVDFDMTLNGFLAWSQGGIFTADRNLLLAPYVLHFPPFLLEIFDYSAVIFELTPLLFLLYSRKGWRIWLLIACTFHFANILLLNIPFINHAVVYLAFVDFTWLFKKLRNLLNLAWFKYLAVSTVLLVDSYRLFLLFDKEIIPEIFLPLQSQYFNLYMGLLIYSIAIIFIVRSILSTRNAEGKNLTPKMAVFKQNQQF